MNIYNSYLQLIQNCLGTGVTYSTELDRIASSLFSSRWLGIFARDQIPQKQRGYMIVNLDNSHEPGSHWVAVADNMFYDSFGRHSTELWFSQRYTNTRVDVEQGVDELNCGARCLALLCVYHLHGPSVAKTI